MHDIEYQESHNCHVNIRACLKGTWGKCMAYASYFKQNKIMTLPDSTSQKQHENVSAICSCTVYTNHVCKFIWCTLV